MGAFDAIARLKDDLADQPENALRPSQVQGYQDELAQLGGMAQGRDVDGAPRDFLQSARGGALRRAKQVRTILDTQAAKRVTGERANRIHAGVKDVIETLIRPAMLPRSAMRRNVPGAVGHLLRTEFNPQFKDAILTVKRGLRALDPDNADPDFTNMERFRPEGLNPDGTSTFAADAQIPGFLALTPLGKANTPFQEPTIDTPLKAARRREAARPARPARPAPPVKRPRVLTEAQRQALRDRLAAGRETQRRKREERAAAAQTA